MVAHVVALPDSTAGLVVRQVSADQLATLASGRRIVVFAPASEIRLCKVTPPVRQLSKALQATPYLLEEQLAEDVEELHFALGARQADGSFPVAVVARSRLDQWLERFEEIGLQPHALVPDVLSLPRPTGDAWSALTEGGQLLVRTGEFNGFACSADEMELMLQIADGGAEPPHALQLFVMKDEARDFTRLNRRVELRPGHAHPLEALARHHHADETINLLQGSLARKESWLRYWQPWQTAAFLAAACFVGGVALNGVQAFKLHRAALAQESANTERFSQIFPGERPASYLSAQIDSLVRHATGSGSDSLFTMLQTFAQAQAAAPGLNVKAMQFHDGSLFLDLTGSDLQVLEKMRGWFATHPGVHLEVPTADSTSGGVQVRLKLTPA